MALQTDLNVSPYHDDFDADKKHYKVLFKPSVAVQARELNNLQSILQHQIEKFGDNVFRRGTVIEGCSLVFHTSLPYVKIKDSETDGTPVNIDLYSGLYVRNSANLIAQLVKTVAGYESQVPDLNTLFVKYLNSGTDGNTSVFSANQTLTVYNETYPIFKYVITDGSAGFSNTDTPVVVSSLAVQNSSGGTTFPASSFVAGNHIQNGVANSIIVEANSTANTEVLLLRIKPLAADLLTANTLLWSFNVGQTISNANTANVANVVAVVGYNAQGSLTTDSLGKITSVSTIGTGSGYYYQPHVSVSITSGGSTTEAQINQLDVTAKNFLTTITVGSEAQESIGKGYGLTVKEGTIYQKGYFSKVDNQLVVVNKYSNTGFDKSVGFYTEESIVNSNQDPTLLDNATGTYNFTAPGADRLFLDPVLRVLDKVDAESNSEFLSIVEFTDGIPYRKTTQTVYNIIGDEMAKRTSEQAGDYVLDQFTVVTKDSSTFSDTENIFKIVIDPGVAYIDGYRVATIGNFTANVNKGTDTETSNTTVRFGTGSYLLVDELGGTFDTHKAVQVELYSAAKNYITGGANVAISNTSAGTLLGYARVRALVQQSGDTPQGTPATQYRMYMFDFDMLNDANPRSVQSILYHDGTNYIGIADTVLTNGPASTTEAVLKEVENTEYSGMLVKTTDASKSVGSVAYTYRTTTTTTANTTGFIALAKPGADESYEYTGVWGDSQKSSLILVSEGNYQTNATSNGTLTYTTPQTNVTGTGTSFQTQFRSGDFVRISNSTSGNVIVQIKAITNATHMNLYSSAATTVASGNGRIFFPNNFPISLKREQRTANVAAGNGHLIIYLGNSIVDVTNTASTMDLYFTHNVRQTAITPTAKEIKRGLYARIVTNTAHVSNTVGPWSLGVPDAFRLRSVHAANVASRAVDFNANTDVSSANDFISIANNLFSNGDTVIYANTGGTTRVGGITNGDSYFVVYANSSGLKLASTFSGANINLTANTVSENHTLTGQPLRFNESSTHAKNVTNDYYVDHNQTIDFLDVSYLRLKSKKSGTGVGSYIVPITNNHSLLVKFDAFTTGAGPKTVTSYTVDDSANLAVLTSANSSINTMEIPEVFGKNGRYFDLRDQIDFRPSAANTIPLISDLSNNAIINPSGGNANTRITAIDWKFPAPDSDVTANTESYLGRNDLIVIGSNGGFTQVQGTAGVYDKYPTPPPQTMPLQYINIKAYPSLPTALSSEMVKIIDTKTLRKQRRAQNYNISTVMNADQTSRIQIKNYKMRDIVSLENRIESLEYYVRFTLAETMAKARFLPSSLDGITDRFKFGFFTDAFENTNFADIDHEEYQSLITEHMLMPKRTDSVIIFDYDISTPANSGETVYTFDFDNFTLISQSQATDGKVVANTTSDTGTSDTVIRQTTAINQFFAQTGSFNDDGSVFEDFYFTFSSTQGLAKFFINSRDNNIALEVSQSKTGGTAGTFTRTITSAAAETVTQNDINQYSLSANFPGKGFVPFENIGDPLNRKNYPAPSDYNGFIEDQFKLSWSHDPSLGQYVRLRIYKGEHHGNDFKKGKGNFWAKLFYPSDTSIVESSSSESGNNLSSTTYSGSVNLINPNFFQAQRVESVEIFGSKMTIIVDSQIFKIGVSGLKPNTSHKFVFEDADQTSKCKQICSGSVAFSPGVLISDAQGNLSFDFSYDAGIDEASTDFEKQKQHAASIVGDKKFNVVSYDGTSDASGIIQIKPWTVIGIDDISTTNPPPYNDRYDTIFEFDSDAIAAASRALTGF